MSASNFLRNFTAKQTTTAMRSAFRSFNLACPTTILQIRSATTQSKLFGTTRENIKSAYAKRKMESPKKYDKLETWVLGVTFMTVWLGASGYIMSWGHLRADNANEIIPFLAKPY
jgi:hypothetical protein